MNPCASSFQPKPTYADTLKSSLSRPPDGGGHATSSPAAGHGSPASQPKSQSMKEAVPIEIHTQRVRESSTEPAVQPWRDSTLGESAHVPPSHQAPTSTLTSSYQEAQCHRQVH